MRKGALITTYLGCLSFVLFLNSCQDDPIVPNGTGGNGVDTTWTDPNDNPDDGLNHDGTCPYGDGCDICDLPMMVHLLILTIQTMTRTVMDAVIATLHSVTHSETIHSEMIHLVESLVIH
ncbi:MAG: hypothetical protein JKY09_00045 [Crocinitomicaceae bacterium]|nr:hypothetical protein [Crocinitomicaceae bacterium]